ncbi:hypothetical protein [uncultured Anaeromusa sp.]|uniref:hypothetical protein n=1 Tax=uncultured Anaeromusa sp. TaxID=673273 RepID=UPI0029C74549|nr:hypothetical protein [uncultured Anaeromusa sp.]
MFLSSPRKVIIFVGSKEDEKVLLEAMLPGQPIGGVYSVKKHSPHTPKNQTHLHVFKKNNQIFAINYDGSAHDKSHGVEIPREVAAGLRRCFPNVVIPANNIIESIDISSVTDYDEFEILFG